MPPLFIGMPVLNGEKYIRLALNSLLGQSFKDWKLLISDNCSDDTTSEIVKEYARLDSRIIYHRQRERSEAEPNFEYLLRSADSEYFMWAAHDDIWHKDFIAKLIGKLKEDRKFGMAFCNIENIDEDGQFIRSYPSFKRFQCSSHIDSIVNFVREPEIFGKANLIYSIYRTDFIRSVYQKHPKTRVWGSDMILVFRCLCETRTFVEEEVLFSKRMRRAELMDIENPDLEIFPSAEGDKYVEAMVEAAKGSTYERLTRVIMELRRDLLNQTLETQRAERSITFKRYLKNKKIVRSAIDLLKSRK